MTQSNVETTQIPGTNKALPHRARNLGHRRLDVGRQRRRAVDPHHPVRGRSRHHTDRHRAGLWLRPFRGDRRPALAEGGRAQGRHRHKSRPRLEGRQAVPQRQPRPHHAGDRRFAAPAADRRHRSLSGALARSERADGRDRRRDEGFVQGRKNPRHRREQFLSGANGQVPRGGAARIPISRPTICSSAKSSATCCLTPTATRS